MKESFFDLHIHSNHSPDGITSCEKILKTARERELDGISITDHDFFDPDLFQKLQEKTDLIMIPGEEVSSSVGHILAYFISEPIEPWRSPEKIVRDIHDQGGIAVMAHPYRIRFSFPGGYFQLFDAVEAFNSRSGDPDKDGSPNHRTGKVLEELDTGVTGGSDSHQYWTIGSGVTIVKGDITLDSIKEQILKGETSARGEPTLKSNKVISQFARLLKDDDYNSWLKTIAKSIKWLLLDFWEGIRNF